jgi:prepilin-type N-terminal cleavage/methylation domain-containing protein
MSSRLSHHSQGFSIVELVVVVAIVGTLAALSLAATFQAQRREQVNAVTIGLAGWLEEVRRSALRGSACEVQVSTGTVTGTNTVAQLGTPLPDTCSTINNPYRLPESAQGASYSISASPSSFAFTPRGTKSPATNVEITITRVNTGPARCIQLNGLLGNLEMGNYSSGSCELTKF